jgi:hypothetical protein
LLVASEKLVAVFIAILLVDAARNSFYFINLVFPFQFFRYQKITKRERIEKNMFCVKWWNKTAHLLICQDMESITMPIGLALLVGAVPGYIGNYFLKTLQLK